MPHEKWRQEKTCQRVEDQDADADDERLAQDDFFECVHGHAHPCDFLVQVVHCLQSCLKLPHYKPLESEIKGVMLIGSRFLFSAEPRQLQTPPHGSASG